MEEDFPKGVPSVGLSVGVFEEYVVVLVNGSKQLQIRWSEVSHSY